MVAGDALFRREGRALASDGGAGSLVRNDAKDGAGAAASSEIAARIPARPRKLPITAKIATPQSNVGSCSPAIISGDGQSRRARHVGQSKATRAAPSQGKRSASKTALVLGGGGFTGGVYEIGALRALDLLAVNHTVNEFDIYVGTSAGSFIASLTANGVTPEEMMRVLNSDLRSPIPDIDLSMLLRPNYGGFIRSSLTLPLKVAAIVREVFEKESSIVDLATGLAGLLPSGFYSGTGIERYVHEVLSDPDRTDDFRHLAAELYLTATDLDTTERVCSARAIGPTCRSRRPSRPPARCR